MSFALAHQNKTNKTGDAKTSTPATHTSTTHHHLDINNLNKDDSPDSILYLQRAIGNQAILRMMRSSTGFDFGKIGIQPKLKISQPGDEYEQEADRVAEQVMRMPMHESADPAENNIGEGHVNRKCAACELKEDEERKNNLTISRKRSNNASLEGAYESTANEISNIRSSRGSSLDTNSREFMEPRFGYDFSNVKIHTDDVAARSAQKVNALAYTIGNDIVFGKGQYKPNTLDGKTLLAHELTHVVQHQGSKDGAYVLSRETAQEVKERYTDWGGLNLQEENLASYLVQRCRAGDYQLVIDVINILSSSDRDDVADEMMTQFSTCELIRMARIPNAVSMLRTMRNEIGDWWGWTTSGEERYAHLLGAILNEPGERNAWNRKTIENIKGTAGSDLEALARLFEDKEIIDDGSVSSRLQEILNSTEHLIVPGLQTGISFEDTGFAGDQTPGGAGFRDPHPSSRNQVGHFLTATGLQFAPNVVSRQIPIFGSIRHMINAPQSMSDREVALRLTIGHEKAPDPSGGVDILINIVISGVIENFLPGPEGETEEKRDERVARAIEAETRRQIAEVIAAFRTQFQSVTDADIAAWNEALAALGSEEKLNMSAAEGPLQRIPINYSNRGNSIQDLRLSLVGWRLGQMIASGEFSTGADVAHWIRINLGRASSI
jgi:hypothetical protein